MSKKEERKRVARLLMGLDVPYYESTLGHPSALVGGPATAVIALETEDHSALFNAFVLFLDKKPQIKEE